MHQQNLWSNKFHCFTDILKQVYHIHDIHDKNLPFEH